MIDRIPPNNSDMEESVLSALFVNNSSFEDLEGLRPDDFYKSAHNKIFTSMLSLKGKGEPVDLPTVAQDLINKGQLEGIGGAGKLASISDTAPIALNIKQYSKTIRNLSIVRQTMLTAMKIVDNGYQVENVEDYIGKAQSEILKIQTTSSIDKIYDMESLMLEAINRIEAAQTSKFESGLPLGLPKLDNFLHVAGSKLILIAGRPGMGKTALALSIARYLASRSIKIGFLSIEMDKESLADRLLSIESDVNSLLFYSRNSLGDRAKSDLNMAAENISSLPIYVDDADCKIQDVERKCRKMKKMGCQAIFIDQLSKIRGVSGQSKFDTYTDNCSAISMLKKELRMPIFLLCQLNRSVEQTIDKIPTLSHLKQTGMLEEDADMVFLLYRPGYYDESIDQSRTQIILAKNRQGETGTETQVLFKKRRGMFELI